MQKREDTRGTESHQSATALFGEGKPVAQQVCAVKDMWRKPACTMAKHVPKADFNLEASATRATGRVRRVFKDKAPRLECPTGPWIEELYTWPKLPTTIAQKRTAVRLLGERGTLGTESGLA